MKWVFVDTNEGEDIVHKLLADGENVLATIALEYGGAKLETHPNLKVIKRMLSKKVIITIASAYHIESFIDATDPSAEEISRIISECAVELNMQVEIRKIL